MEAYNHHLYERLARRCRSELIALRRSQVHLAWFLPTAFLRAATLGIAKGFTHLHLGDALLLPLGLLVARLAGLRLSVTTYGLDVTWKPMAYQHMIRSSLPRVPTIICISTATKAACVRRGAPESRCRVIPCGVDPKETTCKLSKEAARHEIWRLYPEIPADAQLLLTVGRLVPRKGIDWFIEEVMPSLSDPFVYLVAGAGPERHRIDSTRSAVGQEDRVLLLGEVSHRRKRLLYRAAHVFLMPNRSVQADMEGFGIVALEAGANDTPVVASGIEGIRDAVLHEETGLLVEEGDADAFARAIHEVLSWEERDIARRVRATFDWERISENYARVLNLS